MDNSTKQQSQMPPVENFPEGKQVATFAGGCFWCTEAIFEEVIGVESVVSGYAGGKRENPTYEQVSGGGTGHAESVQITFDPSKTDYLTLLDIFMQTHDPTTLNRQGADVGTQYRSAIFYHNNIQKEIAQKYIEEKNSNMFFGRPIVTELLPMTKFYPAEDYHQDYFANNPDAPYCAFVVSKKVHNFENLFPDLMKEQYKKQ
ncbi:MAG: peptide-methionine (S)-S-oxide reductase MsrA [Chitinophagales bacterium]